MTVTDAELLKYARKYGHYYSRKWGRWGASQVEEFIQEAAIGLCRARAANRWHQRYVFARGVMAKFARPAYKQRFGNDSDRNDEAQAVGLYNASSYEHRFDLTFDDVERPPPNPTKKKLVWDAVEEKIRAYQGNRTRTRKIATMILIEGKKVNEVARTLGMDQANLCRLLKKSGLNAFRSAK